jgi:hypothetical protein
MINSQPFRVLVESAFYQSSNKPEGFIYLLGGYDAWHIMNNGQLYTFEISPENFSEPTIRKITSQSNVGFNSPLNKNDDEYKLIKGIYISGLYYYLYRAYHAGNLSMLPNNVEKHFLHQSVDGYQPPECVALVKCVKHRKDFTEKPEFEVKLRDFSEQFTADNLQDACAIAERILRRDNMHYSDMITLRK